MVIASGNSMVPTRQLTAGANSYQLPWHHILPWGQMKTWFTMDTLLGKEVRATEYLQALSWTHTDIT